MKEYRFLDEIYDDLASTEDWLETRQVGLSQHFESEFFAAVEIACSRPESFAADETGYRPVRLKRFSAVMYFTIEDDVIVVAGVFMGGRSEAKLKNRR